MQSDSNESAKHHGGTDEDIQSLPPNSTFTNRGYMHDTYLEFSQEMVRVSTGCHNIMAQVDNWRYENQHEGKDETQ